ncbi:MAG: hypothetical protein DMD88_20115 [Candidatus Rokuibacteriota bacterium]|nr:MAG: hypothetical protein DMD88_20115 [Candidatus Rokubacteria bacterium]
MRLAVLGLVVVSLVLAGCGVFRHRPMTAEASRSPAGEAGRSAAPAAPAAPAGPPAPTGPAAPTAPATPEPPKLAEQLTRVASELSELQNAVAKLLVASRQQEDQLLFLQRRVGELEAQNKSRAPSVPSGFAPPAPMPAPAVPSGFAPPAPMPAPTLPSGFIPQAPMPVPAVPQLRSATTTPAEDLYRMGVEKLRAKELDAAVLVLYDLIGAYPDHPLRESAQFLVADILFQQKDYRGALADFEALIGAVPGGAKVPDALLKIGLCQRGLGDGALAKQTWERLVRDYPGSVAARQARVLLRG